MSVGDLHDRGCGPVAQPESQSAAVDQEGAQDLGGVGHLAEQPDRRLPHAIVLVGENRHQPLREPGFGIVRETLEGADHDRLFFAPFLGEPLQKRFDHGGKRVPGQREHDVPADHRVVVPQQNEEQQVDRAILDAAAEQPHRRLTQRWNRVLEGDLEVATAGFASRAAPR